MLGILSINKKMIDFSFFSNDFSFSWSLQQKTLVIFIAYLDSAIIKAFWKSDSCVDILRIHFIQLLIHP